MLETKLSTIGAKNSAVSAEIKRFEARGRLCKSDREYALLAECDSEKEISPGIFQFVLLLEPKAFTPAYQLNTPLEDGKRPDAIALDPLKDVGKLLVQKLDKATGTVIREVNYTLDGQKHGTAVPKVTGAIESIFQAKTDSRIEWKLTRVGDESLKADEKLANGKKQSLKCDFGTDESDCINFSRFSFAYKEASQQIGSPIIKLEQTRHGSVHVNIVSNDSLAKPLVFPNLPKILWRVETLGLPKRIFRISMKSKRIGLVAVVDLTSTSPELRIEVPPDSFREAVRLGIEPRNSIPLKIRQWGNSATWQIYSDGTNPPDYNFWITVEGGSVEIAEEKKLVTLSFLVLKQRTSRSSIIDFFSPDVANFSSSEIETK